MQFLADISQEVTKTLVNYNAHEELFHILEAYKDDDSKHSCCQQEVVTITVGTGRQGYKNQFHTFNYNVNIPSG